MTSKNIGKTSRKSSRRIFHWVVAGAFLTMLITGLIIYTPFFSGLASGGWTRLFHRIGAVILVGAPVVYALLNRKAARQWLREAAVWNKSASVAPYVLNTWRRRHKLLISVGYLLFALTGMIQWFLKGMASSDVFYISLFIHDILFFSAIVVLLYHIYFEFYWWLWKRRYCRRCSFAYCFDACPVGAIASGGDGAIERSTQKCNNCRLCMEVCKRNSYYKRAIGPAQKEHQLE